MKKAWILIILIITLTFSSCFRPRKFFLEDCEREGTQTSIASVQFVIKEFDNVNFDFKSYADAIGEREGVFVYPVEKNYSLPVETDDSLSEIKLENAYLISNKDKENTSIVYIYIYEDVEKAKTCFETMRQAVTATLNCYSFFIRVDNTLLVAVETLASNELLDSIVKDVGLDIGEKVNLNTSQSLAHYGYSRPIEELVEKMKENGYSVISEDVGEDFAYSFISEDGKYIFDLFYTSETNLIKRREILVNRFAAHFRFGSTHLRIIYVSNQGGFTFSGNTSNIDEVWESLNT